MLPVKASIGLRRDAIFKVMTTIVKEKNQLMVPPSVQRRAGIKTGDKLEFKVSGGIISIIPKLPPAAEYTQAQRRVIDAQLDEATNGPYYGPFETADAAIDFLHHEIRKRKANNSKITKR